MHYSPIIHCYHYTDVGTSCDLQGNGAKMRLNFLEMSCLLLGFINWRAVFKITILGEIEQVEAGSGRNNHHYSCRPTTIVAGQPP